MSTNFPNITPTCINLFSDKNGEPAVHGFVQVVDTKCAKRIITRVIRNNLSLHILETWKSPEPTRLWTETATKPYTALKKSLRNNHLSWESRGQRAKKRFTCARHICWRVGAFEENSKYNIKLIFWHAFAALSLRWYVCGRTVAWRLIGAPSGSPCETFARSTRSEAAGLSPTAPRQTFAQCAL